MLDSPAPPWILIRTYLAERQVPYDMNISAVHNMQKLKSPDDKDHVFKGLTASYNQIYNQYPHDRDMRQLYGQNWAANLRDTVQTVLNSLPYEERNVVDVGSGDGRELHDVLGAHVNSANITCVDISTEALANVPRYVPRAKRIHGMMENFSMPDEDEGSQTIYLNLRAAQSYGASLNDTIKRSFHVLRRGGLAAYSFANTYIPRLEDEDLTDVDDQEGLLVRPFDPKKPQHVPEFYARQGAFRKPDTIIQRVSTLMHINNFDHVISLSGLSETFVVGFKSHMPRQDFDIPTAPKRGRRPKP